MALWLFKEEPTHYSFADLVRDGSTMWGGIGNALALKHLRQCGPGDRVLYYHTGKVKAIVGIMTVIAGHDPDAKDVSVKVKPLRPLRQPVTLADVKADKAFAAWELVRMSRLSVMPVSPAIWKRIEEMEHKLL
jgi:predicted RNA-binding protein with PUA-like domain